MSPSLAEVRAAWETTAADNGLHAIGMIAIRITASINSFAPHPKQQR